jgi:hypothetical protein
VGQEEGMMAFEASQKFCEFIDSWKDLGYIELVKKVLEEMETYAVRPHMRRASSKNEVYHRSEYNRLLQGLLGWLYHGVKPAGLFDHEFLKLKLICESLIAKGQFKPEKLDQFLNLEGQARTRAAPKIEVTVPKAARRRQSKSSAGRWGRTRNPNLQ